jgi:xanthine/CO dehydrogenase XdhC/CoxF family maturation factor
MSASDLEVACAMAHGTLPPPVTNRRLVAVFASAVAAELGHFARHVGFDVVLLDPDPARHVDGMARVADVAAADLDERTDVVITDHDRPELGDVLAEVLAGASRWVGVMGSPRHPAPHIPALRERGVPEAQIARVHRPIGLDIGSRSPAEIAMSTVAGLLADRNGRAGGFPGAASASLSGRG